jgi:hypothetical protein
MSRIGAPPRGAPIADSFFAHTANLFGTAAVTRHLIDIVKPLAGARSVTLATVLRIHTPDALLRLMRHPRHAL